VAVVRQYFGNREKKISAVGNLHMKAGEERAYWKDSVLVWGTADSVRSNARLLNVMKTCKFPVNPVTNRRKFHILTSHNNINSQ
jgi:hypothetical protein